MNFAGFESADLEITLTRNFWFSLTGLLTLSNLIPLTSVPYLENGDNDSADIIGLS